MNFTFEKNQVYAKNEEGKTLALATFPPYNEDTVVINHTFVDPSLRGQGVAGELMQATVEHIKNQGLKVVATCAYAVVWFKRHHDFDDIVNEEEQVKLAPECQI
ncbi:MAG: GNAT family N-acetyltransferase [Acholeplasmataceae bacterium]